jgi:hypothetical protein
MSSSNEVMPSDSNFGDRHFLVAGVRGCSNAVVAEVIACDASAIV